MDTGKPDCPGWTYGNPVFQDGYLEPEIGYLEMVSSFGNVVYSILGLVSSEFKTLYELFFCTSSALSALPGLCTL
jgi:hypothetical protein